MVYYLGTQRLIELTTTVSLEYILLGIIQSMEEDFLNWQHFSLVPRHATFGEHGVIELMVVNNQKDYAFKYVNGHPNNTQQQLLSVTGFGVLSQMENGYPTFISEMTLLTAMRTAATSALAAKYLAPNTNTMALIGTGAQSEFQAHAFRALLGIDTLFIYDLDHQAMEKFIHNLEPQGFKIHPVNGIEAAIAHAPIITTCTTHQGSKGIIEPHFLKPGQHYNAIGGDSPKKIELVASALDKADIFVEFYDQSAIEGEIKHCLQHPSITELWQVIQKKRPGRIHDQQITIFDSVGFALEDYSTLRYIYQLAKTHDCLDHLDLIPDPIDDPKNLYQLLHPA